jgi:cation transport ATPase
MVTEEIIIKGMHCDACERTITRVLGKEGVTVEQISHNTGKARITYGSIDEETIARALQSRGYKLGTSSAEATYEDEYAEEDDARGGSTAVTPIRVRKTEHAAERAAWAAEKRIISDGFLTLGILLLVQTALTLGIYSTFSGYKPKFFMLFLYLPVAIVVNIVALWHQRAYRKDVSCMTGMMVGMTIGMTTGFMIGALLGLTNGMFLGSVFGTIAGIIAGVYAGKCCGIMGTMEGMMAGLMAGTMGAMLTYMMIQDHAEWFIPFLYLVCIAILAGMMKMTVNEHEGSDVELKPWPLSNVIAVSFIVMLAISAFILIAPKGLY